VIRFSVSASCRVGGFAACEGEKPKAAAINNRVINGHIMKIRNNGPMCFLMAVWRQTTIAAPYFKKERGFAATSYFSSFGILIADTIARHVASKAQCDGFGGR